MKAMGMGLVSLKAVFATSSIIKH